MEAHPTLGCIQDQNSWGWVLQITTRSCVNFSVLTALFLHSFGGNRTRLLGLDPVCPRLPATPGSSLWSSEEGTDCSPHFTVQSNTGTEDVGGERVPPPPSPVTQGSADNGGSVCEQEFVLEPWQGSPVL